MAKLYTFKQRQETLRELEIKPIDGKVTGREAAQILTWRAKKEEGIEHVYNDGSIRRHVKQGNIKPERVNNRFNLYKVEDVFDLPLAPKRGLKNSERISAGSPGI